MSVNPLFSRLALITGEEVLEKIHSSSVLVFGAGGVGSWAAESLVRSGIGKIGIVDFDKVSESNVNRQVQATTLTVGQGKAEVLMKRLLEINPGCEIKAWNEKFCRENSAVFEIENADYVIDAIDILSDKLDLIEAAVTAGVKLFSSMGMARKMDPSKIKVAGIMETRSCPLARLVRQGLRERGVSSNFTVVFSEEKNFPCGRQGETANSRHGDAGGENVRSKQGKIINGSAVTVTACAGMFLASLVLRDIAGLM